jgi:uncharacterized protein with von Willebrand factor type A (vWA) domain
VKKQEDFELFSHLFESTVTEWPIELTLLPEEPSELKSEPVRGGVGADSLAALEGELLSHIQPSPDDQTVEARKRDPISPRTQPIERISADQTAVATREVPVFAFELLEMATEATYQRYLLSQEYLPVTRRQLKQSWRFLRRMVREGPKKELDVEETIRQIGRDGFLLRPAMRALRINKASMLLLIDQKGSMVPFHILSKNLAHTATSAGRFGQASVFYFHDCPPATAPSLHAITTPYYREHMLFTTPGLVSAKPVSQILAYMHTEQTGVLIFSDAGAGRGDWDRDRIQATRYFLFQLRNRGVRHIAWLNPIPQERWRGAENSAGAIAEFVNMFSLDRKGLAAAIQHLLGRAVRIMDLTEDHEYI